MGVDGRWLKAGEDEEDMDLRAAEFGTYAYPGIIPETAQADLFEIERLAIRYGVGGIVRTMHWSGATVEKRYHTRRGIDVTFAVRSCERPPGHPLSLIRG
jgi:hypothetical protein